MKIIGVRMSAVAEWQEFQIQLLHTSVPCRDSEMWTSDDALERQEAAQLCITCPLIDQCRAFAVDNREEHGVWGGKDFTVQRRNAA